VIRSDGETQVDEVATQVRIPLVEVSSLSERKKDWRRTTKWGVGALAAGAFVVAVGTSGGDEPEAKPGSGKGNPFP
jgi:hypothetical protein